MLCSNSSKGPNGCAKTTVDDFYAHSLEMFNGKVMSMNHFRGKVVIFFTDCQCQPSATGALRGFKKETEEGRLVIVAVDHYHHCHSLGTFGYSFKKFLRDLRQPFYALMWQASWPLYLSAPMTPASSIWNNPLWRFLKCPNDKRTYCQPCFSSIVDPEGRLVLAASDPYGARRRKVLLKLLRGEDAPPRK